MWTKRRNLVIALICVSGILYLLPRDLRGQFDRHVEKYGPQWGYSKHTDIANAEQSSPPPENAQGDTAITQTTLPGGTSAAGFTIFDRLYVWNGTLYAVTTNPKAFPDLKTVLSQPKDRLNGVNIDPTPLEMQIISPEDASPLLGERAIVLGGTSWIFWDTEQFMAHYYHWWGELILGAMRVYSSLALIPGVKTPLPEPKRFIMPNILEHSWRDRAGVDGPLMRAGWPDTSLERGDLWDDFRKLNQTFVFERAMVISRPAAHTSPLSSLWYKMISSTMNVTVPPDFWKPLQRRVIENAVGYLPVMDSRGTVISEPRSKAPVVTYISRQSGVRRLTKEAHEGLVQALDALEEEGLCEIYVAAMESLTFSQQLEIVARTTIMVGVHGNGLTHQLWMPSSPRSTVIEIFFPKSYLHDYELLARNMGHKHYAVWNDTSVTYPPGQWFHGVDQGDRKDFNGVAIPVHGPTVAELVRERLTMADPESWRIA